MDKSLYHASLLHLQAQGRTFCEAFRQADRLAQQLDPQGSEQDSLAIQVVQSLVAQLRGVCAFIPGAREVFVLALARPTGEGDPPCGQVPP